MKWNVRAVVIFILLAITGKVGAQQIDSLMEAYNAKVPQEKVYVQFDNNLYLPGQTIWYKAYLFTGIDPATASKTFYIDWFDDNGKLVQRTIAPILNSSASGSFSLPQHFKGNHLQVLAYTKWMLNFDSAFLFHRTIPVAQPEVLLAEKATVIPVTSLVFLPEGGDMVEGLKTTVAFKSLSAGLPAAVKGTINNSKGGTVTPFETVHNGMGKISFVPAAGEEYTAEWKDARGVVQHTQLPPVRGSGIALSLSRAGSRWVFTIERMAKQENLKKVILVASMYQQILFRAAVNLSVKTAVSSMLPTDKFPSGVMRLTVMDGDFKPLAERVFFINNDDYLADAKMNIDTLDTGKRGKNVFEIEMPDTAGASLSLAITDDAHDATENIISGLLISPEIKGAVYEPAYYFSSKDDSVAEHLDLVMMTNGWRRFAWENVLAGTIPPLSYSRDTSYLSIAGKIDNMSENLIRKAEQVNLILVAKDSSKQFLFTPLRADGSFGEDNLVLFDTVKVFYQLNKKFIPSRSTVNIGNAFLRYDTTKYLPPVINYLPDTTGMARALFLKEEQMKLDSLVAQTTLKGVVVKSRIKTKMQEMDDRYASSLFKTMNERQFNLLDDPTARSASNIFGYLAAKVAGLTISNPYSLNPSASWRNSPVSFFLNEMRVDASTLAAVSVTDIAYVKTIPPPFIAGGSGAGGAVAVYTKQGGDQTADVKGMDYTLLFGYTPVKQFYSPNPSETTGNFPKADLRRTLYWNPNIITGADNRRVRVIFYNNDIGNKMQVVLEGVTDDGKLIHYTKLMK